MKCYYALLDSLDRNPNGAKAESLKVISLKTQRMEEERNTYAKKGEEQSETLQSLRMILSRALNNF